MTHAYAPGPAVLCADGFYRGPLLSDYRFYRRMGMTALAAIAAAREGMCF